MERPSAHQGLAGILALLLTAGLGVLALLATDQQEPRSTGTEIAIEHNLPLMLTVEVAFGKNTTLLSFSHTGNEEVFLSTPHTWERTEVKNMEIATLTVDPPELGFSRYHLPPTAGISFKRSGEVPSLTLHNPSGVPVQIELTKVNTDTSNVERRTILLQEGPVKVW